MTMQRRSIYIVINEGKSECAYLQLLRSFLTKRMPLADDYSSRLDLIPKTTNGGEGGGAFSLVRRAYRSCHSADKQTPIVIWVDVDIYVRNANSNERRNAASYAVKQGIPDFCFSVMNFEDFLALHFDDDLFEDWYAAMELAGHFRSPLSDDAYGPVFAPIWGRHVVRIGCAQSTYLKGDLPVDFISEQSLKNMIRHARDDRMKRLFRAQAKTTTFPEFLSECLCGQYPEKLS